MILAYRIFTTLLYPIFLIFIYYRKIINKEDPIRYKEKILVSHYRASKKDNSKLIWFHAASIGEFKSIIPIINELNINRQNIKFLITTNTLSSGNLAKLELKKISNTEHRYLPLDIAYLIDKFLHLWKPDKIFLVDSEIWPNLILKAKEHKIPIALINARFTSKSFKRWMLFPKIAKKIFGMMKLFICSNIETKNYLGELNLKNIYFKGNIKLSDDINEKNIKNFNKNILLKRRFWFAASTHKEEDLFCLKTHLKLKEKFKDVTTIIAPRHIERSKEIKILSEKFELKTQILNENENILADKEIIIINYFGALASYFKYAKSVFIGKSSILKLKNNSGQNPLDAAKFRCKIYHGPYVANFQDIYQILQDQGISKKINSHEDLSYNLLKDLEDPLKGEGVVSKNLETICKKTMVSTMDSINKFIL